MSTTSPHSDTGYPCPISCLTCSRDFDPFASHVCKPVLDSTLFAALQSPSTFAMSADGKWKRKTGDVVDLTQSTDDDAPHTPRPRKQLKTQNATPTTAGPTSQARPSSAYITPRARNHVRPDNAWLTPPASSSRVPGSSALPFDDNEEIDDGADYENLESYGVINSRRRS